MNQKISGNGSKNYGRKERFKDIMRKINPYFDDPTALILREEAEKPRKQTANNLNRKSHLQLLLDNPKDVRSETYAMKAVKEKLIDIFDEKCAFCECNTAMGAAYDVEHYRPKATYFWLAYEWTNLLLACQICNREYKKDQFPVSPDQATLSTPSFTDDGALHYAECHINSARLNTEAPLLLHPALHDPAAHLYFLPDGDIEHITTEGQYSIKYYGLKRPKLVKGRGEIVRNMQDRILRCYKFAPDNLPGNPVLEVAIKAILDELIQDIENKATYIGIRQAILGNVEQFILAPIADCIPETDYQFLKRIAQDISR